MHKNTATAAIIQLVWLSVRLPPPEISPFQTEYRLNLACLAVGSTRAEFPAAGVVDRLNLACLAVGSTGTRCGCSRKRPPPQSSLFGCRFDAIWQTSRSKNVTPPQSSLFGCRFDGVKLATWKKNKPPQSSLFGCRFNSHGHGSVMSIVGRLNLACLAVGSTHTVKPGLQK